ncbi:hypothetical protein [Bacterioplanoides sp.]
MSAPKLIMVLMRVMVMPAINSAGITLVTKIPVVAISVVMISIVRLR